MMQSLTNQTSLFFCVLILSMSGWQSGTNSLVYGQSTPTFVSYDLFENDSFYSVRTHTENILELKQIIEIQADGSLRKDVLEEIAKKAKLGIAYNAELNALNQQISFDHKAIAVGDALMLALKGSGYEPAISKTREIVLARVETDDSAITPVDAYQEAITGQVTDASTGETLPGVNIVIDGTAIGTTTDMSGEYIINVTEPGSELIFTYVGYIPQTIIVTQSHIDDGLDVSLESDVALMDEMVVVGFGTQRRADVTGAVSNISAGDLVKRPMTNTALGLQGITPGLTIQDQGGQPGEESAVARIRGTGTLNNANPLVLIDGIEQSLAFVEPSNIETITVLKDAASSSIYGSRAANGVILITTKRGTESGVTVNYNTHVGVQNLNLFMEGASKEDWMMMENEARLATGN
ncbi:MAG: carboxypeptidase-like regulatory domain-containing protein, partial [Balneolales bacterium]